jgi:DNA helicase-2/ATP-dependent DNA helicase PcrA
MKEEKNKMEKEGRNKKEKMEETKREKKLKILNGLNENQKKAVIQIKGPVLIVAGAGSGKTKTLTHRLAYLIASGIEERKILMVTFTNKAAEEMKERTRNILNSNNLESFIGTFHKLGVRILRETGGGFKRNSNFVIFDEKDSKQILKNCLKELDLPKEQFNLIRVSDEISRAKNDLLFAEEYSDKADNFFQQKISKIYQLYQEKLMESNAFDFDDLIFIPVKIFQKNKEILEKYQNRWEYIMVDEYQDTNASQYALIKMLALKNRNLCVVGDDDQSIYSWRQADVKNFLNFDRDWTGTKLIVLGENYRTTKKILCAAQGIIKNNRCRKEKELWTNNIEGNPVFLVQVRNDLSEAEFVVKSILQIVSSENLPLNDFAILYRTNSQSRVLEEAMLKNNLPYQVFAGVKFYERREIKDILAYLRLMVNRNDMASLDRVINIPARGIGKKKKEYIFSFKDIDKLWGNLKEISEAKKFVDIIQSGRKMIEEGVSISDIVGFIIEETEYKKYLEGDIQQGKEKWENIFEFLRLAEDSGNKGINGLNDFLENIALFQEKDVKKEEKQDSVKLMTLHSAKGLEFKVVFIVGMEEGLLPHSQSQFSEEELEEERRLAYVGMTRAKQFLFLVFAERRRVFGGFSSNSPSRFLNEIQENFVKTIFLSNGLLDFEERIEYDD